MKTAFTEAAGEIVRRARSFFAGIYALLEPGGDARIEHVLLRKAGARPYETVSAFVLELDRFLGRVACDDDVSIAVIRRKTA